MTRRELVRLLAGVAAMPAVHAPLAAKAQQTARSRHIGAIMTLGPDDPESQTMVGAFLQGLQERGWMLGRNVRIEYRWAVGDEDRVRRSAAELVALAPDVVLAFGGTVVRSLKRATATVPIVFVNVSDPVGAGLVESLARPGGHATGFLSIEYGMSTKWLELLKQVAPRVTRLAVLRDPSAVGGGGQLGAIQAVAPSFGVEVRPIDSSDMASMERALVAFARAPDGGLIATTSRLARQNRHLVVTLAAKHRLPAVYPHRSYAAAGGLVSYGPDFIDQFPQAAGYVDRILKGEKPADLPVQAPTKYELVINLKAAKALGLEVPPSVLVRADDVIE